MIYRYTILPLLSVLGSLSVFAQDMAHNYVKTVTYLNQTRTDSIVSVQYFDGLGRPDQRVVGGSNTTGRFLHSFTEYDGVGRESRVWSTIIGSNTPDYIDPNSIPNLSCITYNDNKGFSEITYDALDRQTFVTTPGEAWIDKGKRTEYKSNGKDEVKLYTDISMSEPRYYPANALYCTETTDEEEHTVRSYTDFMGRLILERRLDGNKTADTYYVYDDINQLVYVLQPMYQEKADLDLYAFQYTYDERGRVKTKKLPGCNPVEYWYDNADRVIKMQDGILASCHKYRTYTYDRLGRLKTQSVTDEITAELELVNYYDSYDFIDQYPDLNLECMDGAVLGLSYCCSYMRNDKYGHAQLTGTWQKASDGDQILTTYIYDEYGRVVKQAEVGLCKNAIVKEYSYNFVGDVTSETTSYYSYNAEVDEFPLEESIMTYIQNKYDAPHTKLLTSSVITMFDYQTGYTMRDTLQCLTYDDFGRVIRNDRGGRKADMSYAYDQLHGWTTGIRSGGGFEQKLYRETGANHSRWDGSIAAMEWKNSSSEQTRRYDYTYDGLKRLIDAEYSEPSMSSTTTQAAAFRFGLWDDEDMEGYIPDPSSKAETNKYGESYTYDLNCNMTSLHRYGMLNDKSYGLIDDLTIQYNGNQRKGVNDAVSERLNYSGASDFVNGENSTIEYTYENGNLVKDRNKGLNFSYDLLGHPLKVWSDDGKNIIEYVYAADGRKLQTRHSKKSGSATVRDFRGALEVVNGYIDRINFQGGFYSYDWVDDYYSRNYYIQDYQDNIRMTVSSDDWGGIVSEYTTSVTDYYPYGNPHRGGSDYKYSGKYLDRTYGLDLYDFEARRFDAIVPVFDSQDQLAEKYYHISPYVYCAGDPVNCVDPTGMKPDTLESAYMSQDVYNSKLGEYSGKWQCVSRSNGGSFKWAVYAKGSGDSQEYVLAFAGTDDLYDFMTDLHQGSGNINGSAADYDCTEYGKAIELAEAVATFAGDKTLTIVGHSLGASLASFAAMAVGEEAMVFNPAAIHDNTLSTFGIDTSNHETLISAFVVEGEVVSKINSITPNAKVYGTIHPIKDVSGSTLDKHRISVVNKALAK